MNEFSFRLASDSDPFSQCAERPVDDDCTHRNTRARNGKRHRNRIWGWREEKTIKKLL